MSVELNHYLEITRSRIHQIYRELESTGKTITVDLMRKLYYGVDEDSKTLLQVFWKSHATLTLLATQDCPLWLQYD